MVVLRHYTFPTARNKLAFSFNNGDVTVHTDMGVREAADFAADLMSSISLMQKKEEERNESISNQSANSKS